MTSYLACTVYYDFVISIIVLLLYVIGNKWWSNVVGRALVLKSVVVSVVLFNSSFNILVHGVHVPTFLNAAFTTAVGVALTYQAYSYWRARLVAKMVLGSKPNENR